MTDSTSDAPGTSNARSESSSASDGKAGEGDRKRRRRRRSRRGGARDDQSHGRSDERSGGGKASDGEGRSRRRRRSRRGRGKGDGSDGAGESTRQQNADGGSSDREPRDGDDSGRRKRRRRRRGGASAEGETSARSTRSDDRDGSDGSDRSRRRRRRRRRGDADPETADSSRTSESGEENDEARDGARADDPRDTPDADLSSAPDAARARARYADADDDYDDADADADADDDLDDDFFDLPEPVVRAEPEPDDPDPLSFEFEGLDDDENRPLDTRVRNVVGIKFSSTGRILYYESGNHHYERGESVVVEGDRPARMGTVAVASERRVSSRGHADARVRRPDERDRTRFAESRARADDLLERARSLTRTMNLPIKVFRLVLNPTGKKAQVYVSSEERFDVREWIKRMTKHLGLRVEMRQTGVRDEAKMVGGIGSCGLELCCSTWLPEFVPVSIKMAKDQGMVLNPTKVSGQCGRLKCCLVYEQDTYAALRKGLPKLGKRVITEAGEGRVVEVDVLRQRVRVSLGPGEFQVFKGHEVKPMFPSQQPRKSGSSSSSSSSGGSRKR